MTVNKHASRRHEGFAEVDPQLVRERERAASYVHDFLDAMAKAGNPGAERKFGSAVRELVGQHGDYFWSTEVDDKGNEREFIVFSDGRHCWSDELTYSDRPRSADDIVPPRTVRKALEKILMSQDLRADFGEE